MARFARHAEAFAASLSGADQVLVADAGCAMALEKHFPAAGVTMTPKVELLVEVAARSLGSLATLRADVRVRYHDPCQLGRGLGVYEAPRAVLTRILGKAPEEFDERRERATCSGAGGLLPSTMRDTSKRIAASRASEHRKLGGGLVVTACASSLRAFRNAGLDADDISTLIARALA
ncbi:MAG: heterodisulfide reductase-related iron-sulfur binding cluster [Polyangiaceae bacterium]